MTERGLALHEETIWERISALRDIVPPSTRHRIAANFSTASTYVYVGGRLVGGLAWVITTSALLVGLPYALAVEDEVRVAMQEREIAAQQSGAQHVSLLSLLFSSLLCVLFVLLILISSLVSTLKQMMGPTGQQQQQGGIPGAGPGASAQGIRPPGF